MSMISKRNQASLCTVKQALRENGAKIAAFARIEGLEAHARAIEARNQK